MMMYATKFFPCAAAARARTLQKHALWLQNGYFGGELGGHTLGGQTLGGHKGRPYGFRTFPGATPNASWNALEK